MPTYRITTTLTTDVTVPEDFDPNTDGEDILYSLDQYCHPKTFQTGWKMFEESIRVRGEYSNAKFEVIG